MLYFIYGDPNKSFEKATKLVDSMLAKKPDAEVFKINSDNFDTGKLDELISGQSLFAKKYIVQISRILESDEAGEVLLEKLPEIQKSENIFVWVEAKVDVKTLKHIEKRAEKIQEFSAEKRGSTSGKWGHRADAPNIFALADAFGEKNSKKLWLLYLEAIKNSAPEEIHGILWWQLKSMIVANRSDSAEEAGLKPFVYSKSKRMAKNFTEEELENLSEKMTEIYHESRRGGADLETRLEAFVLGL